MASGNLIQGQGAGKLGDVVLMVRNGSQVARVYTKAGARSGDQASEASRIQRVKFGSASNQWSLYRYVCTRMFRKGRKTNQSDYNYFVKRNQHLFPYLSKTENADGVHVLMPGQFSEGSQGRIELVHLVYGTPSASTPIFQVADINSTAQSGVGYTALMRVFKEALRLRYPNARKITYLFSVPSEVSIDEEGINFISQFVTHHTVVIDLYSELTPGEDSLMIREYFSESIGDPKITAAFEASASHAIMNAQSIFSLFTGEGVDNDYIKNLGVLVFATDDNASDCYTTILQDTSIPTTSGPYSVWAGYRTQASLRIAADSYGYQSGVMRDDIASAGGDLTAQMMAYAKKIAAIDEKLAESIVKEVKNGAVQAKVVRKPTTASEDK